MKTYEITICTTTEGAELVAGLFFEIGGVGGGVNIADRNDVLQLMKQKTEVADWDYIDDSILSGMPRDVFVSGFAPANRLRSVLESLSQKLIFLRENIKEINFGSLEISKKISADRWHRVWKKYYKPIKIGDIVICPKWERYAAKKGETVVRLDSGMAFGTGEHETTCMCIELLQQYDLKDKAVVDVGCGSGILGISAVLSGAKNAYMTDLDYIAISASKANARLNKVSKSIEIERCNLLDTSIPEAADVIFANLTADIIFALARDISKFTKSGSVIILSGIIKDKAEQVKKCFERLGFKLEKSLSKNDWYAFAYRA
jgi:ribosomal protein L11 methyltransferase